MGRPRRLPYPPVAYCDTGKESQGSGKLNLANAAYPNEFRRREGLDTSYNKQLPDLHSACNNKVPPPLGLRYVGWNEPGEWFKITIDTSVAGTYVADVLYTSQRSGKIGIEIDGTSSPSAFQLESTFDPAETIPWRQWHHWNVARDAFEVTLPKGVSVMTLRILTNGNLNSATFDFRLKGTQRTGQESPPPRLSRLLLQTGESVDELVVRAGEQVTRGAGAWANPTTSTINRLIGTNCRMLPECTQYLSQMPLPARPPFQRRPLEPSPMSTSVRPNWSAQPSRLRPVGT